MRSLARGTLVAIAALATAGLLAAAVTAAGPAPQVRASIVRQLLADGLACATPGVTGGLKVDRVAVADAKVTATVSGYSVAFKKRLAFDIVFWVAGIESVTADNAFGQKVLDCAGQGQCKLPKLKAGLAATAPRGTPVGRYGPITVLAKVPGLTVKRVGKTWLIDGLKLRGQNDLWTIDCGLGKGTILGGSSTVLGPAGLHVAAVGDPVMGNEVSGCPSSPLPVPGKIQTGDPRVLIDGHPVAVAGSRIAYLGGCGSGGGTVD